MNRIIICDGGFIMFRSILSYKNTKEKTPFLKPTYYFLRMVIGYLHRLNVDLNDQIIIALDGRNSWRKEIDKNYKANRKELREKQADAEWWTEQFKLFSDSFPKWNEIFNWTFIQEQTIEADDIGSVVCRLFKDKEIILITCDGDWQQLAVFPNVKIMNPTTKGYKSKAKNATPFMAIENGYSILESKIQFGDKSDNILGKPQNAIEYDNRKKIVDLINPLPDFIESKVKEKLLMIMPKNLYISKVPYPSIRKQLEALYDK